MPVFFLILLITLSLNFCWCHNVSGKSASEKDEQKKPAATSLPQESETLRIPLLRGNIKLDGHLLEPLWQQAASYRIQHKTSNSDLKESPVATDVKIGLLPEGLLVGFRAYDPHPEDIRAPLRDRDSIDQDDYVGISLDPKGDHLTTFEFYVNARGVQADWVRNKAADSRSRDWDADWKSAAQIDEQGYSVEMLIPLSELEIPLDPGIQIKRIIIFKRQYPRSVRHSFTTSTIKDVDEQHEVFKKRYHLFVPGISIINSHTRDLEKDSRWESEWQKEISLDYSYRNPALFQISATFNPYFLEVEQDLTDYDINDPFTSRKVEKRPFFLKDTEKLQTPFDLVYTINLKDPLAGINGSANIDKSTFSGFFVQDQKMSLIIPGNLSSKRTVLDADTTSGVVRYRYDMQPKTTLGLISTMRTDGDEYHNLVGGADLYKEFSKSHTLRAQWLYASTAYSEAITNKLCEDDDACYSPDEDTGEPGISSFNEYVLRADSSKNYRDDSWQIKYKYDKQLGYFDFRYFDVGENFRSDLGYMSRIDYRMLGIGGGMNYYFTQKEEHAKLRPSVKYSRQESQAGELISSSREIWLNYWGIYQTWIRLGYRNRERTAKRYLQNTLAIEGNSRYFDENQFEYRLESLPRKNLRLILAGKFGTQIDTDNYRLGDIIEIKPEVRWNPTEHIEIGLQNIYRQLDVADGRLYRENYLWLNLLYHFRNGSFFRLSCIDDYLKRNPELYLYEEEEALEHDLFYELLFAWKPSQLTTFFMGAKLGATQTDDVAQTTLDEKKFYIKYTMVFR